MQKKDFVFPVPNVCSCVSQRKPQLSFNSCFVLKYCREPPNVIILFSNKLTLVGYSSVMTFFRLMMCYIFSNEQIWSVSDAWSAYSCSPSFSFIWQPLMLFVQRMNSVSMHRMSLLLCNCLFPSSIPTYACNHFYTFLHLLSYPYDKRCMCVFVKLCQEHSCMSVSESLGYMYARKEPK